MNYGAIGAVIGHEIGHGFDDQGRQFDASGRFRDWWSAESARRFTERTARLGAQYNSYAAIPGLNVNGQLTMGENIGDLGGLEMAYAAYRRHVARHGEPPVIDVTGDQRFFLSWRRSGAARREDLIRQGCSPIRHPTASGSTRRARTSTLVRASTQPATISISRPSIAWRIWVRRRACKRLEWPADLRPFFAELVRRAFARRPLESRRRRHWPTGGPGRPRPWRSGRPGYNGGGLHGRPGRYRPWSA